MSELETVTESELKTISNLIILEGDNNEDYEEQIISISNNENIIPIIPKSNKNYEAMTVVNLRNAIKSNDLYSSLFKKKKGKTCSKVRKSELIEFLKYVESDPRELYENNKIEKKENNEKKLKLNEPEFIENVNNITEIQNDSYQNNLDDLDKLKNNKKINDNVNPYKIEEEKKVEEETEEEKQERENKKNEIINIKHKISLYFERYPWLKSQSFTSNINVNPDELLNEIEVKLNCRNTLSFAKSQFILTIASLEDLNEKYGGGYIKARGLTYQLERNEAFKDCLDELIIKYSDAIGPSLCPEYRLAFILASSLYVVHVNNSEQPLREEIAEKKINEESLKEYSDL